MTVSRKSWCLVGVIAVVGLAAWLFSSGGSPRTQLVEEGSALPPRQEDGPLQDDPDLGRVSVSEEELAPAPTLEGTLEAFWGDQWPKVKEKLAAQGEDPAMPFTIQPWESVADQMKGAFLPNPEEYAIGTKEFFLEWPPELTLEWLKREFVLPASLTESDLYRVEAIVAVFNREIEDLADQYSTMLCIVLEQKWNRGDFVRVPRSTKLLPEDEDASGNFFSASMGSGSGWAIKMSVKENEYPEIAALRTEMQAKQIERDRTLRTRFARWNE